ncbi:MAG: hypothetical protein ABIQ95_03070, partial [Bdellovibrionia bacterium]
ARNTVGASDTAVKKEVGTLSRQGHIYRDANRSSELLGIYPAGSSIKVVLPAKNGFYSVRLRESRKGTQNGWIPESEIQLKSSNRFPQNSTDSFNFNIIRAGGIFSLLQPSSLQSAVGDRASSFLNVGIDAEFERKFTRSYSASLIFNQYSFIQPVSTANDPNVFYFANGFMLKLAASYYLIDSPALAVSASLGAGVALSSAGNQIQGSRAPTQANSSQIITYPLFGHVTAHYLFCGKFGLFLRMGYQIHTLDSIPIVILQGTAQSIADISLSSLNSTVGLGFSL